MIKWTEKVDLYGVAVSDPLVREGVPAFIQIETPRSRVALQDVTRSLVAQLWVEAEFGPFIRDGVRIFWQERGNWWFVRGTPQVFPEGEGSHLEVVITQEVADSFFNALVKMRGIWVTFQNASTIDDVQVEISIAPDFVSSVLIASLSNDPVNWFFTSNRLWSPIGGGGLVSATEQTVAYFTSAVEPLRGYFVRWTPISGGVLLTGQSLLGVI